MPQKCSYLNCNTRPSFNKPGETKGLYCKEHTKNDMIYVTAKTCIEKGCTTIPSFNKPGETKRLYCKKHAKDGMIYITVKTCIEKGCTTQPTFNKPGERKGLYCKEHAKNGMRCVTVKTCIEKGCTTIPNFNKHGEIKGLYCKEHAKDGMICVTVKPCIEKGCIIQPNFNKPGETKGLYCKEHSKDGMINVTDKTCIEKGCTTRPNFGLPGNKALYCCKHKKDGMIARPKHLCEFGKCREISTFGYKKAQFCENHAEKDMINLIEKECKGCKIVMILNQNKLCYFCDPKTQKRYIKAHETEMKHWLDVNGYKYESHDKMIDKGACIRNRPDFIFESNSGSHYIVLEVDENQHKFSKNYSEDCECTRMVNISQALGMPTIFIRYNPDKFKKNKKSVDIKKSKRLNTLKTYLNCALEKHIEDVRDLGYLSFVQLFYDDYDETNTQYITILEYHSDIRYEYNEKEYLVSLLCSKNDKFTEELHNKYHISKSKIRHFKMHDIDKEYEKVYKKYYGQNTKTLLKKLSEFD